MKSLLSIFTELSSKNVENSGFSPVEKLPFSDYFYIGVSEKRTPMFLINCKLNNSSNDIRLEYIDVLYNKNCRIIDGNTKSELTCTILILNDESYDFQNYFLEVIGLILKQLPKLPTAPQINDEIIKIIKLFSCTTKPALKTVQGLWAELLVIEQSKDPEYMIRSWHSKTTSKYDFNDGENKLEVKSTSSSRRIHSFSLEQLETNENSKLFVASVFAIQTGQGKNILDLRESIFTKVTNLETQILFDSILFETLGSEIEKSLDYCFDYQQAIDELKYYDSENIPKIKKETVPPEITNIKFQCDLTNVVCISKKINSKLFDFQCLSLPLTKNL